MDSIDQMLWLPRAVNLLEPNWAEALAQLAAEHDAALVVVETLARAMPGGNENSSDDMSVMVAALDQVREATSACTLAVHHTGKDKTAGSRGHSSFKAAMDTELLVEKDHGHVWLKAAKQRDRADGQVIETFQVVEFGGSCVLDEYHGELGGDAAAPDAITAEFVTKCVLTVTELHESDGPPGPTRNKVRDKLRANSVQFDDKHLTPALLRAEQQARLNRTPRRGGGDYYSPPKDEAQ